ncbi:MAG: hypothetical protein KBS81_02795 [Spirochaetales bacterium]|nr:hypothetical protein [Candidatus Physcosoma equi]
MTKIVALALVAALLVFAVSCAPEAEKHVHQKGTEHKAISGTCMHKGTLAYWECTGCDAKLDADGIVMESTEGTLNADNHENYVFWGVKTPDTHEGIYQCCDKTVSGKHVFVSGICVECDYVEEED